MGKKKIYNNTVRLKYKMHNAMMIVTDIRYIFARYEWIQGAKMINDHLKSNTKNPQSCWRSNMRAVWNAHSERKGMCVSGYTIK